MTCLFDVWQIHVSEVKHIHGVLCKTDVWLAFALLTNCTLHATGLR